MSISGIGSKAVVRKMAPGALLTDCTQWCACWPRIKELVKCVHKGCQSSCLDAFRWPVTGTATACARFWCSQDMTTKNVANTKARWPRWVKCSRHVCLNSPKTGVLCYSLGRAEAHGMLRRKQPRDNVPLVRMVKKKENPISGQVFSFILCQRNVTSAFYCTFSSSRPCASCQTRQHNKRKLVHNKDLKRHAQRPNFYHVSCLRNLLYMWGAVAHIYTV